MISLHPGSSHQFRCRVDSEVEIRREWQRA